MIFNPDFDFHMLISLFEDSDFTSIIHDGYQIKFVTINGLQNLLRLKFNLLKDVDYNLIENGISGLTLDQQQFAIFKQMLSTNCTILENSVNAEGITTIQIKIDTNEFDSSTSSTKSFISRIRFKLGMMILFT